MLSSVWAGVKASFSAVLYVFRNPKLWKYIVIPLLFMCGCIIASLILLWNFSDAIHYRFLSFGLVDPVSSEASSLVQKSKWLLYDYGSYVLIWTGGIWLSSVIGLIIAPLLSEPISDAVVVKEKWNQSVETNKSSIRWHRQLGESLFVSAVYFLCMFVLFFIGLVPIIGLLSPVIAFFCTCIFLSKEILDVPMARHGFSLGTKLSIVRANLGFYMGFGGAVFLMALIPLYNVLVFPIAVVGATRLWHQHLLQREVQ